MFKRAMTGLWLLLSTAFLPSCAADPPRLVTRIERVPLSVPEQFRACADAPSLEDVKMQSDLMAIVAGLKFSLDDCRAKLGATWDVIDRQKAGR